MAQSDRPVNPESRDSLTSASAFARRQHYMGIILTSGAVDACEQAWHEGYVAGLTAALPTCNDDPDNDGGKP